MPESELFRWLLQGGAVVALVIVVRWVVKFVERMFTEKDQRIAALEVQLAQKDATITALSAEMRAGIRAQTKATQMVNPEQIDQLMADLAVDLKRRLEGTR